MEHLDVHLVFVKWTCAKFWASLLNLEEFSRFHAYLLRLSNNLCPNSASTWLNIFTVRTCKQ